MTVKITRDRLAEQDGIESEILGVVIRSTPLYGIEKVMGEDDSVPSHDEDGKEYPIAKFRLKDDDGEVYYEGELHDDPDCINQGCALRWGESYAGCTTIEVWVGRSPDHAGGWKQEIG